VACQLKEAIALLQGTPAARVKIERILNNAKVAEKLFGKLVVKTAGKSASDTSLQEFSEGFGSLIRDVTGVKFTDSVAYTLGQIRTGIKQFSPARFSVGKGVEVASVVDVDVKKQIAIDFYKQVTDGTLDGVGTLQTEEDMTRRLDAEVENVFNQIKEARGTHFLLHELVHAGAIEYMSSNPNEPATKRIEDIYTYLLTNKDKLKFKSTYWETNVDEFLAEALSNPEFMKELMSVVPGKPISRLSNMYEVVLNNVLQILGFKGEELNNLFDVLLDANLKMLDEQAPKVAEISEKDTTTPEKTKPKKESKFKDTFSIDTSKLKVAVKNKVNKLAKEHAELKPWTAKKRAEVTKFLDEVRAELKNGKTYKYRLGKPNTQVEKVKAATKDNADIGGTEDAQDKARDEAFITKTKDGIEKYEDYSADDIAEAERLDAEAQAPVEEVTEVKVKEPITTTINTAELNKELAAIREDIKWLEDAKATETITERIKTSKEIIKLEKRADKVLSELGLEGTIGDRLLANKPARRFKKDAEAVRLSDFFTVKKVYNNLNVVANIFGEGFEAIKQTVGEGLEAKYLDGAKKLTNTTEKYIRRFVKQGLDQRWISDLDVTSNTPSEAYQSLTRLLLQGEPGNYTLPKEVITAMALAINDWMVNYGSLRASKRTDEDINRLLGKNVEDSLTKEERERVGDIDGLTSTAANSIGSIIYKNLGLKIKDVEGENREVTEAKFKTELGLTALAAMEDNKLIETGVKKSSEIFGEQEGVDVSVGHFKFTGANDWFDNPRKNKLLSIGSRYANKVLGTETSMRYPSTTAPLRERTVRNSSDIGKHYDTATKTVEAVNKQEATSWEWTDGYMDSYFEMTKTEEGKQQLRVLLGWVDPNTVHDLIKPSVNGKNFAIESDMDFLEDWHKQMQESGVTEMYFPYKFVKNGRFILDSNTFNPQGKKLHRFAITIEAATVTEELMDDHRLALAMAFGVDIDKKSKANALKEWSELKTKLDKMITDGKTDLEILIEVQDNGWSHDIEHTIGGLAELRATNKYEAKNKTLVGFESKLPIETDAVTSGFILKILQMPIIKDVKNFLAKGGVFFDFNENTSYGRQAEQAGYTDAYNTPAEVMTRKLPKIAKTIEDNLPKGDRRSWYVRANKRATELALSTGVDEAIKTISRNFMKNPFMVFNYGSGLPKIISTIADDAIESLYTNISSTQDVAQVIAIIKDSGVSMKNTKDGWVAADGSKATIQLALNEAKKVQEMSEAQRKKYTIPEVLADNIRNNIKASVGTALEETFTETYGDYIEAGRKINNSFTMMFRLFKQKLDKAVDNKQKELGRHLKDSEINEIIGTLEESLPAIKTVLGDAKSKMMIFGNEAVNYDLLKGVKESGQANVRLADNKRLSGQAKRYKMVESFASGAVVPIHFIDGSIQSLVLSEVEGLGVHDANVLAIDKVTEGTKLYNKGTAQVSTKYSMVTEILNSVNSSINAASKEDIKAVDAEYVKESTSDKDKASTVESIQQDLVKLHDESETARTELLNEDIRFEHAAYEGAHYDRVGETYTRQEPNVKLKEKTTIPRPVVGSSTESYPNEFVSPIDNAMDSGILSDNKGSDITNFHISPVDLARKGNPFHSAAYGQYKQMSDMYSAKIMDVMGTRIVEDPEFITRQFTEGYLGKIILGQYTKDTNTIVLGDLNGEVVKEALSSHYSKDLKPTSTTKEVADVKELTDENYKIISKYINEQDAEYVRFHELVHAGSVAYMQAHPEDKLTKRVEDLFWEVFNMLPDPDMDALWMQSKEEFLAEGMSNPKVIKMLASIKPANPKEYFTNALDVLIDTVLTMLGMQGKRKGTMHDYLVDSFTAMVLEQEQVKKDVKEIKQVNAKALTGTGPRIVWTERLKKSWMNGPTLPKVRLEAVSDKDVAIAEGNKVREVVSGDIASDVFSHKFIAGEVARTTNKIKNCK